MFLCSGFLTAHKSGGKCEWAGNRKANLKALDCVINF